MFVKSEVLWLRVVPADLRLPNKLLYLAVLGEEGEEGPVMWKVCALFCSRTWVQVFL